MAADSAEAVAVLCAALDVEYMAIREHISGPVTEVEERGTLYEMAALPTAHATWKAVLVLTDRDNTPAAVQVERAIAAFRPQVVLFVGVAGGRRDARIGDVVAASAIYNYEAGKDTDAGLLSRIKTMPSSFRLVQQAHAVVREQRWLLRVKPAPPPAPPTASVGPLAAGTKVVAGRASQTARLIDATCGDAQGVEMEGFGVLHAAHANKEVDALVIRGISDLLDGKDKAADRFAQPAAARHAAAFAFELLHRLRPETLQPRTADQPVVTTGSVIQSGSGINVANTGTVQGDLTVVSAGEAFRLEEFRLEAPVNPAAARRFSLSTLLRAASRVVPFTDRATELSQLSSWRDAPARLSVMLVFGPGGQGKTRLAAEFACNSARAGWAVAHARHRSDPRPRLPLVARPREDQAGLLVVVDYAERWPRLDLEQLLQHRSLSRAGPVRVLLLARPAGYWWKALANPLVKLGATVAQLPLGPLADTVAQRNIAFIAARDSFAAILGVGGTARVRPAGSLADDAYDLALTLHMSALVAVDAHRRKSPGPGDPGELSGYLVGREYDHWQSMADNRRISTPPPAMARLIALATLTQSLSHPDAVDLLLSVGLAGDRAQAQALLDDHESCYPATGDPGGVLEPLRPDRLGEDFLADLMPSPDLGPAHGDAWLAGIPAQLLTVPAGAALPGYGPAVLTVLIETGRRWEHVRRRYVVPLLLERPQLALAAGGGPLVTLAGYADLDLLRALKDVLPDQRHIELDTGIAALTRRLTDYGLAHTADDTKRAKLYDEMADRLSNVGLYGEALSATEDAVAIRRRLAQADPATHEPMLANTLGNLGIDLWSLGRSVAALDAMTEAVEIYRRRAETEPGAYEEDLAAELNNLAGSLVGLDRYADALAPAAEAAAIFRRRATADSALMNELGSCLRNLAVILSGVSQPAEALAAAREAVENYRRLVLTQPETYEVELADALRSFGNRLSALQRYDEALLAAEESVTISRRLAAASPGAHEPGLAAALHGLASRLWNVGQRERSLAVNEEAVQLLHELAESRPAANERSLGSALNNLARSLLEFARPDEALLAAEEALEIWQRLAAATPGTYDAQLDRASTFRDRARAAF
jgi:nucleoside phosphorylase/tetratricopeptide (TPR) repeat protein